MTTPDGLIRPEVQLSGEDGNAFAILGRVQRALRQAGNTPEVLDAFLAEATSGDYQHLLATVTAYAEVF